MPISYDVLLKYKNDIFFETGSYYGDSIELATQCGFSSIYSIELSAQLFKHCKKRFCNNSSVNLFNGDSGNIMDSVISKINSHNITYWLDAHYSGDVTAKGKKVSPLIEELIVIQKYFKLGDIILIDDVRTFEKMCIDINTIFSIGKSINCTVLYENGCIQNDIMVLKCDI